MLPFLLYSLLVGLAFASQQPIPTAVDLHSASTEAHLQSFGVADDLLHFIDSYADMSHVFLLQMKAQISHQVDTSAAPGLSASEAIESMKLSPDGLHKVSQSPAASLLVFQGIRSNLGEAWAGVAGGGLDRVIGLAVFSATFCVLYVRPKLSCSDAKNSIGSSSVAQAPQAEAVFQLRVPSLHLAVATLLLLAASFCMLGLSVLCGARVNQDSLHLWHVIAADSIALRLLVAAQMLWNGVQVLQCFVVLCSMVALTRYPLSVFAVCGTFALLPLSLYVTSIGGYVFATLTLISALSLAHAKGDVCLSCFKGGSRDISSTEHPGTAYVCKFQALLCACYFVGGYYNHGVYGFRAAFLPNWDWIWGPARWCLGKSAAASFYGLGLDSVLPDFVPNDGGTAEDVIYPAVFAVCWSILPFFFTAAFVVMLMSCKALPKPTSLVAQAFCFLGLFHFLFLTDLVSYRFGRGFVNSWDHWAHFFEKICWRVAMILPVLQKAAMAGDKGILLYVLQSYTAAVFVVQILLNDLMRGELGGDPVFGVTPTTSYSFLDNPWGYFSATTLACFLYFCICFDKHCDYLVLSHA